MASSARSTNGPTPSPAAPAATGIGVAGNDGKERARPRPGTRRSSAIVPAPVMEIAARRLRVLGHPIRLQLLEVLANGPGSVTDLARILDTEHQLVSKHLSELLRSDVVVRRQEGNFALYSLPDALTLKAVALVCRSVIDDRARLARLAEDAQASGDGRFAG